MNNLDTRPDQAGNLTSEGAIRLHGPEAFAGMRKAGQLAAAALDMLTPHVKPGVTTSASTTSCSSSRWTTAHAGHR